MRSITAAMLQLAAVVAAAAAAGCDSEQCTASACAVGVGIYQTCCPPGAALAQCYYKAPDGTRIDIGTDVAAAAKKLNMACLASRQDLSGLGDFSVLPDLAGRDFSMPPPPDMAMTLPDDMAMTMPDLAVLPDFSVPADFSTPDDLSQTD
jgi:hypothetical protein